MLPFSQRLLLVALMLSHLFEEMSTGFRQQFPLGEMPRSRFLAINLLLYGYYMGTYLLLQREKALGRLLARLLALGMMDNGVGHLGIMMVRWRYFPGGLMALPLILATLFLLRENNSAQDEVRNTVNAFKAS